MVKPTLARQFAVGNCHDTHSRLRQIISIAMLGIALPVRHWQSLLRSSVRIAASFEDDRMWRGREEKGLDPALLALASQQVGTLV